MIGVSPYISFKGNCQEAIDFYTRALDAQLLFSQKWGETPHSIPGMEGEIMHATIKIGDSKIMMCDAPDSEVATGGNISLTIGLNDVGKTREMFDKMSDGGNVKMPLDKTFWAESFGMLTDKFGINWMFNCENPQSDHAQATG